LIAASLEKDLYFFNNYLYYDNNYKVYLLSRILDYFSHTDIGNYRSTNEDFYSAEDNLFIAADGMGGHNAGEVASKQAVEVFKNYFFKYARRAKNPDLKKVEEIIRVSIKSANTKVHRNSKKDRSLYGMGTTLTACYIFEDQACVGHVGDSRLYLKRGSKLGLMTMDHTMVGELYRNGKISAEEAFSHPQKNILTNVIGTSEDIKPDVFCFGLKQEDLLLICTDGLNSMLTDKAINKIMGSGRDIEEMGKKLINNAKRKGGLDNITLIIIRYE